MKTQASGELSLEAAYFPMEDVTEEETDESSGAMRSWTDGGIDAARQAESLCLHWRLFVSFHIHLSLVLLKLIAPSNGRKLRQVDTLEL